MPRRERDTGSDASSDDGVELGRRPAPRPVTRGDPGRLKSERRQEMDSSPNNNNNNSNESETFVPRAERRARPRTASSPSGPSTRSRRGSRDEAGLELSRRPTGERPGTAQQRLGEDLVEEAAEHEKRREEHSDSDDDIEEAPANDDEGVKTALMANKEREEQKPTRIRRNASLGSGDAAAIFTFFLVALSVFSFQVLCLMDGQCKARRRAADPALNDMGILVIPLCLMTIFLVAPLLLTAADAGRRLNAAGSDDVKRRRRDRFLVIVGCLVALVLSVLAVAAAIERPLGQSGRGARRDFRKCDDLAQAGSGRWRDAGSCKYENDVNVHYRRSHSLAKQQRQNEMHIFIAALAFSCCFLLVAVTLLIALCALGRPTASFDTTSFRRRPRLLERRRPAQ